MVTVLVQSFHFHFRIPVIDEMCEWKYEKAYIRHMLQFVHKPVCEWLCLCVKGLCEMSLTWSAHTDTHKWQSPQT